MKILFFLAVYSFVGLGLCEDPLIVTTTPVDVEVREEIGKDLDKILTSHKAVLFSKTYCPFSKALKGILGSYKIDDLHIEEVNLRGDMKKVQDELQTHSHIHTVPQFYLNGEFVGNYDKVHKLERDGKLRQILEDAGVVPKH
ncbi:unnamed protein product [Bursaphelenchus okinawaensis]|uniref:Glutaredoxin domain-containing protein n=1 Tax=Bursaphelenchus okinawaensis TaxID=465554 RepID=A0A811KDB6_9BILA|nr:unnamed protein product [Bursaphelenchus okinawaensis]CAG9102527.1 unnamed protein product [Bursaphelenchus okinawaensis]